MIPDETSASGALYTYNRKLGAEYSFYTTSKSGNQANRILVTYLDANLSVAAPAMSDWAKVAEAPWSVAEWAVAPRFDHPRATVLVLLLG